MSKPKPFEAEKISSLIKNLDQTVTVEICTPMGECTSKEIVVTFPGDDDGLRIFGISQDFVKDDLVETIIIRTLHVGDEGGIFQTESERVAVLGAKIAVALYRTGWIVCETEDGYW